MKKIAKRVLVILGIAVALVIAFVIVIGVLVVNVDKVNGEGDMVKRSYDVGNFDSLEIKKVTTDSGTVNFFGLGSDYELIYRSGQESKVEIEAQGNLFDYIQVSVEDGTLILENSKPIQTKEETRPKLYVTMPKINTVTIHGDVLFKDADKIEGGTFEINVFGFCNMDLDLDIESLGVNMSGGGTMKLRGNAQSAIIDLSGRGKIEAMDLDTIDADVNISGIGDCEISCSGTLKTNTNGGGKLRYKGSPALTENKPGMDTIEKVD